MADLRRVTYGDSDFDIPSGTGGASSGSPAAAATTFFNSPNAGKLSIAFPMVSTVQYYFVVDFAFLV